MSAVAVQRQTIAHAAWARLASAPSPPLLALWADAGDVCALFGDAATPLLVATTVTDGGYPALSPTRPAGAWFERMTRDLWGYVAIGGVDARPWADHGCWLLSTQLASRPCRPAARETPEFGFDEALDQFSIGPVRGGIEAAVHLRLAATGETIARLQLRLGYTHKGVLGLLRGKSPRAAARFAARVAGEATVAHSLAFARAAEAASGCEPPPRAQALREVMLELEAIAGTLDAMAAMAETMGGEPLATRCAWHGEALRRAAQLAFGHRLMMDCVVPGGVAGDLAPGGDVAIHRALADIAAELPALRLPEDRLTGIGVVAPEVAAQFAVEPGDAATRAAHCFGALHRRIAHARDALHGAPNDGLSAPMPVTSGEAIGRAEGVAGPVWHWLRLEHGQIDGAFLCDPAWTNWQIIEAAAPGTAIEDLPLLLISFGLSASGIDL
jgi:Ni,Fe-hydrogenase III large subunit